MAKYLFTVFWRDGIDGSWHRYGKPTTWRKAALLAATAEREDGGRFVGLSRLPRPVLPGFAIHYGNAAIVAGEVDTDSMVQGFGYQTDYHAAFDRYWDLSGRPIKG